MPALLSAFDTRRRSQKSWRRTARQSLRGPTRCGPNQPARPARALPSHSGPDGPFPPMPVTTRQEGSAERKHSSARPRSVFTHAGAGGSGPQHRHYCQKPARLRHVPRSRGTASSGPTTYPELLSVGASAKPKCREVVGGAGVLRDRLSLPARTLICTGNYISQGQLFLGP